LQLHVSSLPLADLIYSLQRLCPFHACKHSSPLLAEDMWVRLPGPSSSGSVPGYSIFLLGRVTTVADIPSPLGHCLPPSSGSRKLLANSFKVLPCRQSRRQVVPLHKHLRDSRSTTGHHANLQNLFWGQMDGKVRRQGWDYLMSGTNCFLQL